MAKFDWIPYLEGKYLNYYQWFAVIGTFVLFVIALLSILAYLILCKIWPEPTLRLPSPAKKKLIDRLKNITFNGCFVSLTIIPLICMALGNLYLIEGMLGMMAVSVLQIYLDNGRQLWKP
jgi:hypothetical protein